MAVIRFSTNLTTARALQAIDAIQSNDRTTLSLRFVSFRGGTSLPLELSSSERASVAAVQTALEQTVSHRGYSAAEITELHRAVGGDPVVAGIVIRATVRALEEFWHENPELVHTITHDPPVSN